VAKCPWCEKYMEMYLRDDGTLSKQELEEEKQRLNAGFWASIKEVQDEHYLANKALDVKTGLKMNMPVQIDMKSGETSFGRFWFFSLAKVRDKVSRKELKHLWVQSGGCSMSWATPICCELANSSSNEEQIAWEIQGFKDLKGLTEKILNGLKEEYSEEESSE